MASRVSLIQSRSIYVGTANNVAPSDGNLIVTGNVGIGTTSPTEKLVVTGAIRSTNQSNNFSTGGVSAFMDIINGSKLVRIGSVTGGDTLAGSEGDVGIFTRGNEVVRITSAYNVGIGTTSPGDKLHVNAGGTGGIRIQADSEPSLYLNTTDGAANATLFNSYGNVGLVGYATSTNYIMYHYGGGGTLANQYTYFQTAGAERMRINGAGNVGIGTTSPYNALTINRDTSAGTVSSIPGIAFKNRNNTNSIFVHSGIFADTYRDVADPHYSGGIWFTRNPEVSNLSSSSDIVFGTGFNVGTGLLPSERMRITSSGNVGIGTTAPGAKLEIAGTSSTFALSFGNSVPNNPLFINTYGGFTGIGMDQTTAGLRLVGDSGGNNLVDVGYYSGNVVAHANWVSRMRVLGNGNVGIGTTSPAAILHVSSTGANAYSSTITKGSNMKGIVNTLSNNADDMVGIYFGTGTTSEGTHWSGITGSRSNSAVDWSTQLNFYTHDENVSNINDATQKMVIKGSGNVGIGTTSPTERLHVDGNVVVTYNGSYQGINSIGNKAILARVSPTTGIINYAEYATAANLNGFVMGSDDARVKGNIATDSLEFITNGSTRMTVLSSGNVGVNTTTPGTNFHVVGDVLIQTGALGVGVNPNATDGRIDASNDIVAYSSSDRRLKENITPIANALDKVKSLTGVEFDWKPEHKKAHGYEGHDTGVIAQEVQEVMPTAVRTNDTGYLAVRYEKMIGLLIEAMKEQQTQIDELKAKLDGLTK